MKVLSIITLIPAALLVLSCGEKPAPVDPTPTPVINPHSSLENVFFEELCYVKDAKWNAETKAGFDLRLEQVWDKGDAVSVFRMKENNEKFYFRGQGEDLFSTFEKDIEEDIYPDLKQVYAFYPYDESLVCDSEGQFTVEYPSTRKFVEPGLGLVRGNIMLAACVPALGKGEMEFKHLTGYLGLRLYSRFGGEVKKIEILGNNGEVLSGEASVVLGPSDEPEIEMKGEAGSSLTVVFDKAVILPRVEEEPLVVYVTLPPTEFSRGITVKATCEDGLVYEESSSARFMVMRAGVGKMETTSLSFEFNGTRIASGTTAYGLVTDKATGAAIAGVPVTDGFSYSVTDENGVYQLSVNPGATRIYYSLPAGYRTVLDETGCPAFFSEIINPSKGMRIDFKLEKQTKDETDFTLFAIADPQVISNSTVDRYRNETVGDIVAVINAGRAEGRHNNVYAFTLGDLTDWHASYYGKLKESMSCVELCGGDYLPFYQCIGNHDHREGSDEASGVLNFVKKFGPTDYSVNIGKAHIIVMDNYYYEGNPFASGNEWAGFTDAQVEWLRQDLATVADKSSKLAILCVHAPFGEAPKIHDYVQKSHHYDDVLSALAEFHDAHVLSGHTHYSMNFIHHDYVCASGRPIYSHNQAAACGYLWDDHPSDTNMDGAPMAYYIYQIEGNEMVDWRFKANNGRPEGLQMRVFDGNQVWVDPSDASNRFSWYDSSVYKNGDATNFCHSELKDCMIVNLWDGDFENWTVTLSMGGETYELQPLDSHDVYTCDMPTLAVYDNPWGAGTLKHSRHYWYVKLPGVDISSLTGWTVTAVQNVPSSKNISHTYTANTLQTDFSGYGMR